MARRGWGGSTAAALGVAAGAGAAQLGFGYGLGIINWAPTGSVRVEAAWVASLAWATWIAATSVIAGAVCAQRLRGAADEPVGTLPRLGLALAAGAGALVTVLLVAVPARAARVPDTSSPQTVAATYAAIGLVLGVLLATWALHTRAAATNLIATTGWLWLLAVVSVIDGVLSGRGLTTAQLGIWQISADRAAFWVRDYFYWPGVLLSLGSALVIGVLAARRAVRPAEVRVGAAASGAAGPLLVALAYLLAVPRLAGIAAEQLSAHLIAPYAVIAGLGGSLLVAALAQRADRRSADRTPVSVPRQRAGKPDPASTLAGYPQAGRTDVTGSESTSSGGDAESTTGSDVVGPEQAPGTEDKPTRRFFGRRAGRATPDADAAAAPVRTSEPASAPPEKAAGRLNEPTGGTGPDSGADPDPTPGIGAESTRVDRPAPAAGRTSRSSGTRAGSSGRPSRAAADRSGRAVPPQRQPDAALPATDAPDGDNSSDATPPALTDQPKTRRKP
ncbi:hypothetical protein ACIBP4_01415 [Micromonospora maritima]|uniref:Uncharacterized protein n=1 Tax=Micromonospora maritima TaxID=986711 RepID=A0ABW7ZE77_9ACTN